ncbi:MAG: hypothetical protein ACI9TY_000296 [Alphaproteobacteria bacterium]|jgi:hypothetical protein
MNIQTLIIASVMSITSVSTFAETEKRPGPATMVQSTTTAPSIEEERAPIFWSISLINVILKGQSAKDAKTDIFVKAQQYALNNFYNDVAYLVSYDANFNPAKAYKLYNALLPQVEKMLKLQAHYINAIKSNKASEKVMALHAALKNETKKTIRYMAILEKLSNDVETLRASHSI